ncbi:glycosyltransferase family 4 protein [Klebsiella quasipneumoniae subsp. quasipneumoniae]|uniref:glycosyltransferase family 4 protein n=1 Tax=Klebsiella quasipneumoniae TaxID=1463165 RepID=UPI001E5EFB8A|nr:glycosyltransferase family 4 protein [Klebsiella quasipneumoniae]MCD7092260.1 glycosyltransferase family 4 protein [Klebsiella quasipneumoniae subsp. similipneumoniae]
MLRTSDFSVGIVADWFVTFAGSEKVVAELIKIFPSSELYSIVDFLSAENKKLFNDKDIQTSFIQKFPFAKKKYQTYLPFMPLAIEQMDVSKHDIVISSSHAVAKGVLTGPDQLHISYVHSPIRYAWDLQHQYLKETGLNKGVKGALAKFILHKMRIWDVRTANGVDHFIANSHFIARRIKKVYGRNATVIYPPVDVNRFSISEKKDEYYLTASRLVPYKRIDLVVDAFAHLPDKKLVVIGDGPEMSKIRSKATKNIEILGYQDNQSMEEYMRNAKAFVFAAEEDFGITPVEAMACGTPVIAFGKGGTLETVRPHGVQSATGVLFYNQTTDAIINGVLHFEKYQHEFEPITCREHSLNFSTERFNRQISEFVFEKYNEFNQAKKIIY